ncbi:MAG TPA: phosphatase PAP2 family protein [Acidimicrobiales bacterium]|jgi:hypothetical protein|nr:phosphatase PAP2 family protein [Acidimicrobiales bacterium]
MAVSAPVDANSDDAAPARRQRSPLWIELLVVAWLCVLYDSISNDAPLRLQAALAHARSILHVEAILHLHPELALNHWAARHAGIALQLSDFYDIAHFVVTLGLVAVLWFWFPRIYPPLRNTLVLINVIGFVVFWLYPLAPPRMLPSAGFVDLVAVTHAWGSWRVGALASQANELAAMPSLHIAWAVWSALAAWRILKGRWWRGVVFTYPGMTAIAVMATANHYFLDVVAGVATIAAAYWLAKMLGQAMQRPKPQAALLTVRSQLSRTASWGRQRLSDRRPPPVDADPVLSGSPGRGPNPRP